MVEFVVALVSVRVTAKPVAFVGEPILLHDAGVSVLVLWS
jgi:hypothetical protein